MKYICIYLSIYFIALPVISLSRNVRPKFASKTKTLPLVSTFYNLYRSLYVCILFALALTYRELARGIRGLAKSCIEPRIENASSTVNKLSPGRGIPPHTIPAKKPPTRETHLARVYVYVLNFTNVWHRSVISPARWANRRISWGTSHISSGSFNVFS